MKTRQISRNLKLIATSMASAIITTSFNSVSAKKYRNLVPEIGWSSRLSSMGLDQADNIGKSYNFYCQPAAEDSMNAPIWGTYVYTVNSGICSTAVHSGMITKEEGGKITIELLEGQEFYTGSYQNDVTSQDHRGTDLSFTFVGDKLVQNQQSQLSESGQQQRSSGIQRVVVDGVQKSVERSIEEAITNIFK